jgi:tellurite methyltransferase
MPLSDAHKWNQRYQEEKFKSFELPRPFLLENAGFLPGRGLAIDVAMGWADAGFLLERGLQVIGLDISQVAVYSAKSRYPELMTAIIDLTRAYFPPSKFDVILNFYYLQRDLWPIYKLALRPGGILIYETLTIAMLEQSEDIDPDNLLAPGELHTGFKDLQVLVYREGWMTDDRKHSRAVASLVARKTAC